MTIEERVEMLEEKLDAARRLIRRLMFGAGIFLGMFVLFVAVRAITGVAHGQAKEKVIRAEEIRAKRIIVEDGQFIVTGHRGEQVAILGMIQDAPGLRIGVTGGWPGIALSTHEGPNLYLADATGPRIMLSIVGERPSLALFNRNKMDLVDLALSLGKPGLTLTDEKGDVLWQAP